MGMWRGVIDGDYSANNIVDLMMTSNGGELEFRNGLDLCQLILENVGLDGDLTAVVGFSNRRGCEEGVVPFEQVTGGVQFSYEGIRRPFLLAPCANENSGLTLTNSREENKEWSRKCRYRSFARTIG